ncbi:hypothetical protein D3C79_289660 [compost metagenome]
MLTDIYVGGISPFKGGGNAGIVPAGILQQHISQIRCLVNAHATGTQGTNIFLEQIMVRRIVQIDSIRARHVEFETPQRVGGARCLTNAVWEITRRHHVPVNHRRVDDLSVIAPAGKHGIAVFLEIAAVTHCLWHNIFAYQRSRHIPRRVDHDVVQRTVHQRRLAAGPTDDNP